MTELMAHVLSCAGHDVICANSGAQAVRRIQEQPTDVAVVDLRLPDISGHEVLKLIRQAALGTSCIMMTGFATIKDAVVATRLGAIEFLEKPVTEQRILECVNEALGIATDPAIERLNVLSPVMDRWARSVIKILESPTDPKTVATWAKIVVASPGALRNWCRTAEISPRRSLVFGRFLRAVALSHTDKCGQPEHLLDAADLRTIDGLLRFAGLKHGKAFPRTVRDFLKVQILVRDGEKLSAINRALEEKIREANLTNSYH